MDLRQRKESPVSIEEIVHTCSNEKVAHAAVASLGFAFATRVRNEAESHGVTTGAFVARLVREFGRAADAGERRAVQRVMDKADQPILCGLRFILEGRLRSAQGTASSAMADRAAVFPAAARSRHAALLDKKRSCRTQSSGRRAQGRVPAGASGPAPG